MEISYRYVDDFGFVSRQTKTKAEAEKANKQIDERGLEEYGYWEPVSLFCRHCGLVNENTGHMGCQMAGID